MECEKITLENSSVTYSASLMSRQQLIDMYQRQVDLGGMSSGGALSGGALSGGLFTPESRAGLANYRAWHAAYKMSHPMATRDELKEAWRMHKMGGFSDMTPMMGASLSGGRRVKGLRHCMEETKGPSGRLRCHRYAPGPLSAMGSSLVGGYPGQRAIMDAWEAKHGQNVAMCRAQAKERRAASKLAEAAYKKATAGRPGTYRLGALAAAQELGVPSSLVGKTLRAPRPSKRKPKAPAPIRALVKEIAENKAEAVALAEAALSEAALSEAALADAYAAELLGEGVGRMRLGRR